MRIFLDANVVFSASNIGSSIARLVHQARQLHELVTSDFAMEEARRNILLKRPQWFDDFNALSSRLEHVTSVLFDLPIVLSEKDRPILCTAIATRCEVLTTGDKTHFGPFYGATVEGVLILSLSELAATLLVPP